MFDAPWMEALNAPQRAAVRHGEGPLLVLAGAGSGKTRTLACRVARLLAEGVPAERVLLLTFTRRAARELLRRAGALAAEAAGGTGTGSTDQRVHGGTFHSLGNRLLRRHGDHLGLDPGFSVVDQGDAADLLGLIRDDLGLASRGARFPRPGTLVSAYSRTVNAGIPLSEVLSRHFPWCAHQAESIAEIFRAYTARKRERGILDYDDLLLWCRALVTAPGVGECVAAAYDHVLVDEYQDTNALQADILAGLRATCRNLTVVGDDAQAIYGFRSATVDNILRFPDRFPGATVVRLEQSYRSTQPVLDAANGVMAAAGEAWDKTLWSTLPGGARPRLHTVRDEEEQSEKVCTQVLERREQGLALREQAVLFRTGHHSDHLEVELTRRGVPFVKFGGLKFLEAAHVKDLLALLRLLDNPADELAWFRVLQLLDGVGPAAARRVFAELHVGAPDQALRRLIEHPPAVPASAVADLEALGSAIADCADHGGKGSLSIAGQVERLRAFYAPLCARRHDDATARLRDLEQLELVAAGAESRTAFVTELVLDPPSSTEDLAGPPLLDEDYLILSTIHSAKGLEWDSVHVLHAVDGMIPSDMACGSAEEIDEERRLLYVAVTRARRELSIYAPLRYYHQRFRPRDAHGYAQVSRFLSGEARAAFDRIGSDREPDSGAEAGRERIGVAAAAHVTASVTAVLDRLWQ